MMKNVYYLASQVEKEKFRLDIKYQSDTTGVYLSYIPEAQVKSQPIIRVVGADRLDNNNKARSNGYYDYVEGYTVSNGRVFIPKVEPFGSYMRDYLVKNGVAKEQADKSASKTAPKKTVRAASRKTSKVAPTRKCTSASGASQTAFIRFAASLQYSSSPYPAVCSMFVSSSFFKIAGWQPSV